MTPEEIASIQGVPGEQGPKGDQGEPGPKGADGTMSFEDLTPEQKESLKGEQGLQGIQGEKGGRKERNAFRDIQPPEQLATLGKGEKGRYWSKGTGDKGDGVDPIWDSKVYKARKGFGEDGYHSNKRRLF